MIISGKEISIKIKEQLKEEVAAIKENYSITKIGCNFNR